MARGSYLLYRSPHAPPAVRSTKVQKVTRRGLPCSSLYSSSGRCDKRLEGRGPGIQKDGNRGNNMAAQPPPRKRRCHYGPRCPPKGRVAAAAADVDRLPMIRLPKIRKNPAQQKKRAQFEERAQARADKSARASQVAATAAIHASSAVQEVVRKCHMAVRDYNESYRIEREKLRNRMRLLRDQEAPALNLDEQSVVMSRMEEELFGSSCK